jgi:hypothetical protein
MANKQVEPESNTAHGFVPQFDAFFNLAAQASTLRYVLLYSVSLFR